MDDLTKLIPLIDCQNMYTNLYEWSQITGGWNGLGNDVLLWYWNVYGPGVTGETPANFNDFRPFGNWRAATVKQFAQTETVCQMTVNRDIYYTVTAELPKAIEMKL
ncbi:unnamed protein product [Caenorhabditis bovis]|uniref:Uncharacterized protein n=1 Tax=Caenorhabditis bovis TaxID=2654633 RepID=A0A8S1EYK5_9PELO|nr:unnamed protein product [Caenorhabditis bovis]